MVKGWARCMYENQETVSPADFKSVGVEPVCDIPEPAPWPG